MKHPCSLFWLALALLVACGGKSQTSNGGSANTTGGESSGSSAGSAGQMINCPDAEPREGAPCVPGLVCAGFGTLSCPDTASCGSDGKWQIECPAMQIGGGSCNCAHPLGNDAGAPSPLNHRPSSLQCTAARAPARPAPQNAPCSPPGSPNCAQFLCSQDSDCTDGQNGRCQGTGPIAGLACSYDECVTDDGCPQSSVCQCRPDSISQAANYCTKPGTCRVDSDCGVGGFCSPSQACGTLYYCHTPADTCLNDSDCPSGCNFDASSGHWGCGGGCGPVPP